MACRLTSYAVLQWPSSKRDVVVSHAANNDGYSKSRSSKDHYQALGLLRNASQQDVKSAFRKLAHKYHPDVNKARDAENRFKKIRLAYEVLSNEASKMEYDRSLKQQRSYSNVRDYSHQQPTPETVTATTLHCRGPSDYYFNLRYGDGSRDSSRTGRKRRIFEPTWVKQVRGGTEIRESVSVIERDLMDEWRSMKKMILVGCWGFVVVQQIVGNEIALGIVVGGMIVRNDVSRMYKLGFVVSWLVGGVRGVACVCGLAFTNWVYGDKYDGAALALLVGLIMSRYVCLPSVLTLLVANRLLCSN